MRKIQLTIAVFYIFSTQFSLAQDPQYSQFYANPIYLNPALTGLNEMTRAGTSFRNQWTGLGANFVTFGAFVDHFSPWYKSGIGLSFMSDRAGDLNLGFSSIHLSYSYRLRIAENWVFRPGFAIGYMNYGLNTAKLRAASQYGPDGVFNGSLDPGIILRNNLHLIDLGVGGVLHSENFWIGYSAYHLNRPNQKLTTTEGDDDPMPIRHSAHGGYKWEFYPRLVDGDFFIEKRERSLVTAFNYKHQGGFDQVDIGAYYIFEPMLAGIWYSGFLSSRIDNEGLNNESINVLLGVKTGGGFFFGYSYDFPLTELSSSHEISILYEFSTRDPRKPDKDKMRLPCPWL